MTKVTCSQFERAFSSHKLVIKGTEVFNLLRKSLMENSIFCAAESKNIPFTLNSAKIMLESFIRKKKGISEKEGLTKGS